MENSLGYEDIILFKTDSTGNLSWFKNLGGFRGYDARQTRDGGYIVVGSIYLHTGWADAYLVKTDALGNTMWTRHFGGKYGERGTCVREISDNTYIVTGSTSSFGAGEIDVYLAKLGLMLYDTDDPLALAYNGNRHLVREPNTERLHLVYTRSDSVIYHYSLNGGTNWFSPLAIGKGKFPTITLCSNNLPSVAWTDDDGGLWYRRKINETQWSAIYHLYDPLVYGQARLNAPPSIVITPPTQGDSVHILVTLQAPGTSPINWLAEYRFRIDQPMQGSLFYIEGGTGPNAGPIRSYPSLARSAIDNSLHAAWQRADTICYATRQIGQTWNNWGPQFGDQSLRSAHPFVETYGDMVYVVWQHQKTPGAPEEVYKGWRHLSGHYFYWTNLSQTPDARSLFPVSASGYFTVYVDEIIPHPNCGWEIFYKVHPEGIASNISGTLERSTYPQAAARFTPTKSYLYTAWLEGDKVPYEIRFKKISHIPMDLSYLTSINGCETPSFYLVARDSFISNWQVPVDIGYETITYQFPLKPGYRYKIKVVAYHEGSGAWQEWVIIDRKLKRRIKYNPYQAKTLEFWIPPAFYKDGVIEVVFDRITGAFATAGPIEVYQYEYEESEGETAGGGAMIAHESYRLNNTLVTIFPNPFKDKTDIRFQLTHNSSVNLKIYDVSGRLVKQFSHLTNYQSPIIWSGEDENGQKVPAGVYFLKATNTNTKETVSRKIIKVK